MIEQSGDPRFEERAAQRERLERIVLTEKAVVVNVHGAPGSGRSSFVHLFADQHAEAFPGGITWLHAHGDLTKHRSHLMELGTDEASLVVLDEIELADVRSLTEELRWLREQRRHAQTITISQLPVSVGPETPSIEMPPLPLSAVLKLLARGGGDDHGRSVKRLAALLEGNAAAVNETSRRLASGMPVERIIEWLETRRLVVARDPQGVELPLGSPGRQRLDAVVNEISAELIAELAANPKRLYELSPRRFEELVAELYRRRGFEATLTPASGDEGVDVYVVRNDELGRTLWVVQAKRYHAHHKVGAGVVRELLGTVQTKNASAGIVVTTSFFQPGAVRIQQDFEYRISLRDYLGLQDMLRW